MLKTIKKMFNLEEKYKIEYTAKENILKEVLLYIPKDVTILKITNSYDGLKKESDVLKKGSIIWVVDGSYYYHNPVGHDDLCEIDINGDFVRVYNRCSKIKNDKRIYINKNFLYKYAIPHREDMIIKITSPDKELIIDFRKIKVGYWNREDFLKMIYILIDIFKNYEPEVVNQFAPGIINTMENFVDLVSSEFADQNSIVSETYKYIREVYETIISFGETVEEFPSPLELVDEEERRKAEERRRAEEEHNLQKAAFEERQREFLEKTKSRRNILKDFNEPLENVSKKLAKKNEEIKNRWKKK